MKDTLELEVQHHSFIVPGYTMVRMPSHILGEIQKECNFIKNNFDKSELFNGSLAGQITHQYKLEKSKNALNNFINEFGKHYFSYWGKAEYPNQNFLIDNMWVNFQRKYEFNPVHNHSGVLSFVLWLQIPYDVDEEYSLPMSINSTSPCSSAFNFHYTNLNGQLMNARIKIGKEHEGVLMMFPSWLSHSVNPFYTSDEYRISVSGNLIDSDPKYSYSMFS